MLGSSGCPQPKPAGTGCGTVAAQFGYDPYGSRSTLGYGEYFTPAGTGLDVTLNRAYDPTDGRWLNRDPIGALGGANLGAYVGETPLFTGRAVQSREGHILDWFGIRNVRQTCWSNF